MSVTDPAPTFVRVTDETTTAELRETLRLLCDEAEHTSRRGAAFTRGNDGYARVHGRIDAILSELEARG